MLDARANFPQFTRQGNAVGKLTQLPFVGNRLVQTQVPQMSVQQLQHCLMQNPINLLIDVLTPAEYKQSHIPGAVLVPLQDIEQGKGISEIKSQLKSRKLLAYCTAGKRSARALILLHKAGIDGTKVQGGINAWTQEIEEKGAKASVESSR